MNATLNTEKVISSLAVTFAIILLAPGERYWIFHHLEAHVDLDGGPRDRHFTPTER